MAVLFEEVPKFSPPEQRAEIQQNYDNMTAEEKHSWLILLNLLKKEKSQADSARLLAAREC